MDESSGAANKPGSVGEAGTAAQAGGPSRSGIERPTRTQDLAVVIPTRHANADVLASAARARAALLPAELVVVQAEDAPPPAVPASGNAACHVLTAPRGRGTQCNAGARASSAPLLCFLHDDTELPPGAARHVHHAFADPNLGMACFRLRFDQHHPLLAFYGWCTGIDSVWTTFGDQGYLVRRSLFDAVGGFPNWPLFEDVELARRVRRQRGPMARIRKLPATVTTSAARYRHSGVLRQQLRNLIALLRFFAGASPWRLAAAYEHQADIIGRDPPGNEVSTETAEQRLR
jgi:cellulose synthase/poly-beta-1,6-N-acetylglucosamine synthase-like glycosyltransferase